MKFDAAGKLLWCRTWAEPLDEDGNGVAVDSAANVYVVGSTQSFGFGWADVMLLKFNSLGDLPWSRTSGGASYDDLAFDSSGDVHVAAKSTAIS